MAAVDQWYRELQRGCFWLSILLPVAYLSIAVPQSGPSRAALLIGVLGIHLVTLALGHGYRCDQRGRPADP